MVDKLIDIMQAPDIDCIIVDKVFASCQQRECFTNVEVECKKKFNSIRFGSGFIVPNTLIITDLENRPNFRRVRFTARVPFQILDYHGNTLAEGFLPDIFKDIVLYLPDARDEFLFRIIIETRSQILSPPDVTGDTLVFTAGVFLITKVVGTVQLQVPAYGYCPEPSYCEEYSSADICQMFDYAEFPDDFFPPQLVD